MKNTCENCGLDNCEVNSRGICSDCDQQEPTTPIKCTECGVHDALTEYGYEICNMCLNITEEETEKETKEETEIKEFNDEDDDNFNDDYDDDDDDYHSCRPSWGGVSWGSPGDGYPIYDG